MEGPQLQGRRLNGARRMEALAEEVCQTPKQSEGKRLAPLQRAAFLCKGKNKNIGSSSGHQPLKLPAAPLPSFQVLEAKCSYCLAHQPALCGCLPLLLPPDVLFYSFTSPPVQGTCMGGMESHLFPLILRGCWRRKEGKEGLGDGQQGHSSINPGGNRTQGTGAPGQMLQHKRVGVRTVVCASSASSQLPNFSS